MIFGNEFCLFFLEKTYIQNYLQFVTLSFSLLPIQLVYIPTHICLSIKSNHPTRLNLAECDTVAAGKLALSLTDKCNLPGNTNAILFFLAGYRSDDVTEKNAACWLLPFSQEPVQKKAPILHLPDDYQHESEGSLAHDFILQRVWASFRY
jgi:hypothetical protein